MGFLKFLKPLIGIPNSRSLITISRSQTPSPSPIPSIQSLSPFVFDLRPSSSHSKFLSPLSRLFPYSIGPLSLSSPPWKFLQSSTPLYYLEGKVAVVVVGPSMGSFNLGLNLIKERSSEARVGNVTNVVDWKELEKGDVRGGGGGGFKESFVNLPNLISMSRLVSGPFLGWMIINEWYLLAFVGLAVSGATDWLDGYVARKMGINSVIGSYLDPLADKVLIGFVVLAMVEKDLLPSWLVGLVLLRDVGLIGGALYNRASSLDWKWKSWSEFTNLDGTCPQKVKPLFISKVNTVFQLTLVAAALLQLELGTVETQVYITYLSWLVASTTTASTLAYGVKYISCGGRSISNIRKQP